MAEVIQFNCPACGTLLRLPLEMAAQQGACPSCSEEIVAPDPYRGIGGHVVAPPVLVVEPEPFRPFAETPPVVPAIRTEVEVNESPPEPEPEIVIPAPETVVATPVREQSQKTILVLSSLLAGAVGLAMGYAFGVRTARYMMISSAETQPLVVAPKVEKPAPPVIPAVVETAPVPVPDVPKSEPPPPPPPVKASAAAEAALRAFLEAPDWAARSAYVLDADKVRNAMEAYSHEVPDGPTACKSITVKQSQIDEVSGNTLFIFQVTTEKFPSGIPVAVKETSGGWLVDWLAFVEFRDGLFQSFLDGPVDKAGFFHLIVTPSAADSAEKAGNENFVSYFLQSPLADEARLAFVKKNSHAAITLQEQTANGRPYAPVLEVVKRATPDKKDYFEILSVKADDWFPR